MIQGERELRKIDPWYIFAPFQMCIDVGKALTHNRRFAFNPRLLCPVDSHDNGSFLQVDASLLYFVPRAVPLIDAPFVIVEQVVKAIFSERRKTIRNSLR